MMQKFDRLAWQNYQELVPGQSIGPGKSIVFAITKHHAARLTDYLNQPHSEHRGRYAEVITSDAASGDELIRKFKRKDYPQIAVSVGMLDTGFDCREVLHLVMCRRVRRPILYQQIRGRGTRTAPHIGKQKFVIYDLFGNHDYFNDSDTDIFTGTGSGRASGATQTPTKSPREIIELGLEDEWLETVAYVEAGPEGEPIDKRDHVNTWDTTIQASVERDPLLQKIRDGNALTEDEEQILAQSLNNPELYFNEESLCRAYRRPGGTLIEFIRAALGGLKLKSREEELTENF
jgi:type I restriction enzyme, R subunit